jgi:hypothetical protein
MKRLIVIACLGLACVEYHQTSAISHDGPNPFCQCPWQLRLSGLSGKRLTIEVYDVTGKDLGIGFAEVLGPSETIQFKRLEKVTLDSAGVPDTSTDTLPSGVYFYRIKTSDTTFTRKAVVLK